MATAPFPFPSLPSAATYHHPFPIGFTIAYAPSPVFSPPPFDFGAPVPGFSPAPANSHSTTILVGAPVLGSSAPPAYDPFGFPTAAATHPTATPTAPTREHPQPHPAHHTSASKVAAAPTQAQLEEEISGRLPREVLSIQKRLDLQQSSVDRLQIDISSLTEVVAQIGVALGKPPAPSTAPNSPAPTPKPAMTTQSAASVSSEFYGALSLQSSLCGRPKLQQHKEGGSGDDLTMGSNTRDTSINGKKLVHKQPGLEILSMGHAGSTYHFAPAPSPVLDLDKSYGWQLEFQQGTTSVSPALHVFDEMPTPGSGYENYCYGHPNPVKSSCMHGGSTNLIEQHLDGMPQSYGFHNLNCRSIFLADGSEHSYFALPENYPLERVVLKPVFDVYDDETDDRANAFLDVSASTLEQLTYEEEKSKSHQAPKCFSKPTFSPERPTVSVFRSTNDQPICGIEKLNGGENLSFATQDKEQLLKCFSKVSAFQNVPDIYVRRTCQEESHGDEKLFREKYVCQTVTGISVLLFPWDPGASVFLVSPLKVDTDKPMISPDRPTDDVFSLTNEKETDNEWISVCVHKTLDNTFSAEDTEFAFPHGQVTHAARSIKPIDERSTQADSILFVQGATMHYADEISNIKKQDVLVNKHGITSSTLDVSFLMSDISPCEQPCDMSHEKEELLWDLGSLVSTTRYSICFLKSGVREAYPILPCIWDPGIEWFSYKRLHLFPWIPGSAIIILQQLHSQTISSLFFSLEKGRQVHWDPGIKLLLSELLWLKTVSKGTAYALRHLLSVKFSTHDSTYFIDTVATMCSPANLSQQGRNYAAVLPFWLSIFSDMQCCRIFPKCNAMSSQWNQDIKFNVIALWLISFNPP